MYAGGHQRCVTVLNRPVAVVWIRVWNAWGRSALGSSGRIGWGGVVGPWRNVLIKASTSLHMLKDYSLSWRDHYYLPLSITLSKGFALPHHRAHHRRALGIPEAKFWFVFATTLTISMLDQFPFANLKLQQPSSVYCFVAVQLNKDVSAVSMEIWNVGSDIDMAWLASFSGPANSWALFYGPFLCSFIFSFCDQDGRGNGFPRAHQLSRFWTPRDQNCNMN
jgi:hypothetical protein